jgi:hypothetical protein
MPKLNELGLGNEAVGAVLDYDTVPEQMQAFAEPPQPGAYRFRLPTAIDSWDTMDHANCSNPGKRLAVIFDRNHPLTIIQSPGKVRDGEPFECRINNAERRRGKRDDPAAPEVSDMDYLFRDAFDHKGQPPGRTLKAYAQQLLTHAGQEFGADIEWSWNCNSQRNIRVDNGAGGYEEVEQKGCGARYYQADVPKVLSNPADPTSSVVFPLRHLCACGASLRAFPNLTRYRK